MTRPHAITASPGETRSIIQEVGQRLRGWNSRRQARRAIGMLHRLSDYQLRDIGLPRSEINRMSVS